MLSRNIRKNIDHLKSDIAAIEAQLVDLEKVSGKQQQEKPKPPPPGKSLPVSTKPCSQQKMEKPKPQLDAQNVVETKEIAPKPVPRKKQSSSRRTCPCKSEMVKTVTYEARGDCLAKTCCAKARRNCHCDCESDGSTIDHVHHRICLPIETLNLAKNTRSHHHKSHRHNKSEDGNATWADALTTRKGSGPKRQLSTTEEKIGKVYEVAAISGKLSTKIAQEERQRKELFKKLEEKDKAIAKLSEKLQSHEQRQNNLKAAVSRLREELEQAQEAQERLRLEAQLKTLEGEKSKVLLAAKDMVVDDIIRKTQALDDRLKQQRDFDRNVAANLEVENALMSLKTKFPYLNMNSLTSSSVYYGANNEVNIASSSPIKGPVPVGGKQVSSTPTSDTNSLDRTSSWHAISKIEKL